MKETLDDAREYRRNVDDGEGYFGAVRGAQAVPFGAFPRLFSSALYSRIIAELSQTAGPALAQ